MISKELIKPCPFCGNKNVTFTQGIVFGTFVFVCRKCGADVMFYGGEKDRYEALNKWNSRSIKKAKQMLRLISNENLNPFRAV